MAARRQPGAMLVEHPLRTPEHVDRIDIRHNQIRSRGDFWEVDIQGSGTRAAGDG